jgi:short-subunit dehydrogenase
LLTGATSGIGLATARLLAAPDTALVLVARDETRLDAAAADCRQRGAQCLTVSADVRDPKAVERAFTLGGERFGRLDGVVHAAAVATYGRFEDVPEEVFTATHATNLLGTAHVARTTLRHLRAQGGGNFVVVGSLLGDIAVPYMSAYVSTKWGVHALVRILQIETRGQNIGITLVSPGGVDTPIYDNAATYLGRKGQPPGRVQSAEQVAARVVSGLHRPRRQVQSGPLNRITRLGFRTAPAAFDLAVEPLMRWQGLRRDPHPHSTGNVLRAGPGPLRTKGRHMKNTKTIQRDVQAPASAVWSVLSDGWTYATWVVGASRVRDVDETWPATGTRIHHSFGPWPAVIQDYTRVEASVPEQELVLKARGWPVGEARVVLRLTPTSDTTCRVSIEEDAIAGPGKAIPASARQAIIGPRNRETLYRLALIAEGRYRNHETP